MQKARKNSINSCNSCKEKNLLAHEKIHLIPVIEENDRQSYDLSLKIGFDKDYVVKSIKEFIDITENNIVILAPIIGADIANVSISFS